ncbi:MAG: methyltransferase domain-containing protein [Betaproteobacteria bacterium]|nr:methyltransferase domain-containing protein [Betaproteobacteria bacterium]
MDFEQARFNMVEQQIRTWDVLDPTVLELLLTVRREDFVPPQFRQLAFADMEIPLGHGECMLAPKLEARLLQEAAVQRDDQVLEVGTGSGYTAALAARLARHVYSVEIIPELSEQARRNFQAHGITNVTAEVGDAARGWASHAPYDVILITGSLPLIPEAFEHSLAPGGRLLAVVGDPPVMSAQRIRRTAGGGFGRETLFETCIKALRNAPQPERFVF